MDKIEEYRACIEFLCTHAMEEDLSKSSNKDTEKKYCFIDDEKLSEYKKPLIDLLEKNKRLEQAVDFAAHALSLLESTIDNSPGNHAIEDQPWSKEKWLEALFSQNE